jgi:Type II secretory pathway, component PulF
MISSGITPMKSFDYFKKNTSTRYFKNRFSLVYENLERGSSVSAAFENGGFLEQEIIETISYAEYSGFLPDEIMRLSGYFKERSEISLKILTKGLFFFAFVSAFVFLLLIFFFIIYSIDSRNG